MEINYWSLILINVEMRELSADQIFIAGEIILNLEQMCFYYP